MQLYINDQLADLSDDSPVALTFQINDLGEVKNQQGNTSNQFKIPLTQRNRRILGFPDDIAFCTGLTYTQYTARLIQDGLEIIPYGVAELSGIDQDTASLTVLSGNVDFFDAIDGKLYDMGDSTSQWSNYGQSLLWKQYDHTWSLDNVTASQSKTDGWIWPVVDYGFFTEDFTQPINVNLVRPGFFIKTAIDVLLQSAGYKGNGSLLDDPLYPLLIAQFSNSSFEHGSDYQNQPDAMGISATLTQNLQVSHVAVTGNVGIVAFGINADPGRQFFNGTTFTAAQRNLVNVSLTIPRLRFQGRVTGSHPSSLSIYIRLIDPQASVNLTEQVLNLTNGFTRVSGDGGDITGYCDTYNAKLSTDIELAAGQSVTINYEFKGDRPSSFVMFNGAALVITSQKQSVKIGQMVQCERIFPDISQKDLLKDVLQRFAIICQTNNTNRIVSFNALRDIVNNIPVAKDWTAKCLDQGKSITFKLGGYAQVNYLRYKADTGVLPQYFADDQINIADATLPATTDLITSQFAPTLNRPYVSGTVAQILMADQSNNSQEFTTGVSPRILIDQKLSLPPGKTVTFTDGTNTAVVNDTISIPYFYKPDGGFNLCFCDKPGTLTTMPGVKTKYYPELQKVLTQTKKVVRYFLLTPRDILELDLTIPVYLQQDNAYYYINKIDAWRKGQPAKVELVKLG